MDNRVFNVNGKGAESLSQVLELSFKQIGRNTKAEGFAFDSEKGLILLRYLPKKVALGPDYGEMNKFPAPLSAKAVTPIVMEWLNSDQAKQVNLTGWDRNSDHDGHNSQGWRVYVEDWGHVSVHRGVIAAITPAYMWHGK